MKICHCTLPISNPDVCKHCFNNEFMSNTGELTIPFNNNPVIPRTVKRITTTITKYDKYNKVKSHKTIIIDEEIITSNNVTITSSII